MFCPDKPNRPNRPNRPVMPAMPAMKVACFLFIFFVITMAGCERSDMETATACSFEKGPCVASPEEGGISLMITPSHVPVMKDLRFVVELSGPEAEDVASVRLGLEMPGMYMGENIVILQHTGWGRYEGSGVIPDCPSGKRLWSALVSVVHEEGQVKSAEFLFEASK